MSTAPAVKQAHVWERDPLDWYVEPPRVTTALARVEKIGGRIWDPCCGGGNIVTALRAGGLAAHGTDIERRVPDGTPWFLGERDFLLQPPKLPLWNCIVMNPPFFGAEGAEDFIRRAHELRHPNAWLIAAFVDVRFLAGGARANGLYAELPPSRVWMVTPRVSCPPGSYLAAGNKAGNGSSDWCWLVWDLRSGSGRTELNWLRVDA
jgi:hypothetical protein